MIRPSPARRIRLALLIALHGTAALCGPAMHRHDRAPGGVSAVFVASSDVDCPVCQVLAQGQVGVERVRVERPAGVEEALPRVGPRREPHVLGRASRPRAPPQV